MRIAAALAMLAVLTGCQPRAPLPALRGVASIDFCADQMLLGLVPKDRIRAVSFEADSDTSFAVPRAHGIERLRPQLEDIRSEEHPSELQSLMRISYAVFCLKKKKKTII